MPPDPIEGEATTGEAGLRTANYSGPDERCQNCDHFEEPDHCSTFDATVDQQGRCDAYAPVGGTEDYDEASEVEVAEVE
jgi:hypothetical protein